MDRIGRRAFLRGAGAVTGGVLVSGPLETIFASAARAMPHALPLGPVADLRDGNVRLHLPPGFQYRSFHDNDSGDTLPGGAVLPGRPAGWAAGPGAGGNVWLVRNHEINGPVGAIAGGTPYDAAAGGGTTTILVTPFGEVVDAFVSLNGTQMNCAGGEMPWGSWLTCEETVNGPEVGDDFTGQDNSLLEEPHGYIFEVPAGGQSNRTPIRSAGRFAHEAAAYSPIGDAIYLTEDNFGFPSGFYRYLPPNDPMNDEFISDGGELQMLAVVGMPRAHLEARQRKGATYDVEWITIDDPDPDMTGDTNNEAIVRVGDQGREHGAALFSRLEGAVFADGAVHFTSTQGGGEPEADSDTTSGFGNGAGQVWSYDPVSERLTCRYQSPNENKLELPDNVTARSETDDTLVLCEDGPADNYVRGLTANGRLFDIALNRLTATGTGAPRFGEEFAGATFSPDGHTLFVNIQASKGITFAIWGPWENLRM